MSSPKYYLKNRFNHLIYGIYGTGFGFLFLFFGAALEVYSKQVPFFHAIFGQTNNLMYIFDLAPVVL